ncbi:MAG TPA: hypothetical protein PLI05_08570 [Methanotrichaceae archaeon]|nr:hypothetical protein [Methanotrichaceae archaeon]HQF17104.1 hypothetical protein [Methanotrichaceae archaeon]HQI91725.1 hypothetical protein [Methanotrichaceae archaeon]HQJ28948.1 hypothetical protein [Methanotrichaceae archaeon]
MNQETTQLTRFTAIFFTAAILIAPGVMALTASMGGVSSQGQIQSTNTFSLATGSEIQGSTVIGFAGELSLSDSIRGSGTGPMAKSVSTGTPGKTFASAYAYLDGADSWSWNYRLGTCRCYVGISESLSATNGAGLFAGGLSYNTRGDFAAAQIMSEAFKSLAYSNTMITNSRGALATQSMSNAVGSFKLINWADWVGNVDEIRDPKLFDDPAARKFGPVGEPSTQHAMASAVVKSSSSSASYISYADSYYGGARARQSLSSGGLASLSLDSLAKWGQLFTKLSMAAEDTGSIRYSSSMNARSSSSSGQQSVAVKAGVLAGSSALAGVGPLSGLLYESKASAMASDPAGAASYTSTDRASARGTLAMVEQRLTATGQEVSREASSVVRPDQGYQANVRDLLGGPGYAEKSRLSGSSRVSASLRSALNSGSWSSYTPGGGEERSVVRGVETPLDASLKLIGQTRYSYAARSTSTQLKA